MEGEDRTAADISFSRSCSTRANHARQGQAAHETSPLTEVGRGAPERSIPAAATKADCFMAKGDETSVIVISMSRFAGAI
jgi:hypothetical protein